MWFISKSYNILLYSKRCILITREQIIIRDKISIGEDLYKLEKINDQEELVNVEMPKNDQERIEVKGVK